MRNCEVKLQRQWAYRTVREATKEVANKVVEIGDCHLYGRKLRTIFLAGSPLTYLSTQVGAPTCEKGACQVL